MFYFHNFYDLNKEQYLTNPDDIIEIMEPKDTVTIIVGIYKETKIIKISI